MTNPKFPATFWAHVDKTEGCWLWTGRRNRGGYGNATVPSGRRGGRTRSAHRVAYELSIGPIPVGLDLDHLCRVRHCVNPAHLEPVTRAENIRRGDTGKSRGEWTSTHCSNGHLITEANVYWRQGKWRICRDCTAARMTRFKERHRL